MALNADLYGRKVNHSTRKTFATTLLQSDRPITEVAQLGGWKSVSTLTHYNVPSIKQQSKASKILFEIAVPESPNMQQEISSNKNTLNEFDTVKINEPEDSNTDNMNSELETSLLANENIPSNESVPNPIFSQSTATSSNMIATATRKERNPFSILCGASISGSVINLNIYSGKRKHCEMNSSQE